MAVGALACFMHGLFPFLFTRTGSGIIAELNSRMILNRTRQRAPSTLGSLESAAL
jgi:hypothetical protein